MNKKYIYGWLVGFGIFLIWIGGYNAFFRNNVQYPDTVSFGYKIFFVGIAAVVLGILMAYRSINP